MPATFVCRDLDAVVISHAHLDHLDVPSLRLIDGRTPVAAAARPRRCCSRLGFVPLEMEVGDEVEIAPVPAPGCSSSRARARRARRPRGYSIPAVGKSPPRLRRQGRAEAYFAGDTGLFDGMRDLAGDLDVAILSVGGWGPRLPSDHLNPLSAAKAFKLLRPAACVPVHWGTIYPPWLPPAFNAKASAGRQRSRVTPRTWRRRVDVRNLEPGEATVFIGRGGEERSRP